MSEKALFSPFVKAIIEDHQRYAGIVHEDENIACNFFALISKEYKRDLRLHLTLQNLSGAGKSTLAEAAIKPFKLVCPEDVIEVSRFTGAAVQRFGKEKKSTFDGKIFYHAQAFGDESSSMLPLLSEGKSGLMVTERADASSKYEVKIYDFEGMPCFLTTTTVQLDPQFLRRVILRTADESAIQTKEILTAQARSFEQLKIRTLNRFPFVSRVIERVREYRPHSVIEQVIIPYAHVLNEKLPDNLEMRSNHLKFLKLIASVALVKSVCYRGLYEIQDLPDPPLKPYKMKVAIATVEDFNDAYTMAGKSFFQPLSAAETNILEYLGRQISSDKLDNETYAKVRIRDIQRSLKLSRPYIYDITKELQNKGLIAIEILEEHGHKVSEYQFASSAFESANFDIGDSTPEKWLEGKTYEKLQIEDPFGEVGIGSTHSVDHS